LRKPKPPHKQSCAHEYNVVEKPVMRIWDNRAEIEKCSFLITVGKRARAFCASVGNFSEVEDILYTWIDVL
jgi:hypothetical protein